MHAVRSSWAAGVWEGSFFGVSDPSPDVESEKLGSFWMMMITHMRTMVLEYLPAKLGHKHGVNVGKYSSTMEHMGNGNCTIVTALLIEIVIRP